jgi:hypothetical protein
LPNVPRRSGDFEHTSRKDLRRREKEGKPKGTLATVRDTTSEVALVRFVAFDRLTLACYEPLL